MGSSKSKIRGRVGFVNFKSYKAFKVKNPESKITYEQYISILKESTNSIRDFILNNTLGFKLPYNLGHIAVNRFKPTKGFVAIDWPATLRLGRRIPLLNLHSFGYAYALNYYPNTKMLPLKVYDMEPHRIIKRMLAQNIKNGKQNYIELDEAYFSKRFTDKYQKH